MDAREERGLAIAAKCKITKKDDSWLVPSQNDNAEKYTVIPGAKCSCPDHEVRQVKCKHLWAVEYVLARETAQDGTVTETEIVKVTRVTHKDLPAELACRQRGSIGGNDAVQCPLGRSLQWRPATYPRGPRLSRTPTGGYALCLGIQVYTGFSSCRFTSDLREAKTDGLVASTPYFKSVTNYLTNPDMTPILKHLVTVSSLPLKAVETQFAADSSGFTTSRSWSKPRETSIWSESQPIRHI